MQFYKISHIKMCLCSHMYHRHMVEHGSDIYSSGGLKHMEVHSTSGEAAQQQINFFPIGSFTYNYIIV